MEISIKPTTVLDPPLMQHSVTITVDSDELTLDEVAELLRGLLIAWGFASGSVDELIPPR